MLPINRHPSSRQLQSFRFFWFPLFVAAIGGVTWWRFDARVTAAVAWTLGALLVVTALRSREGARIIFAGLQTVTYPIALLVSTLALAILFYLVFVPVGWIMRVIGRDPLRLNRQDQSSGWVPYQQKDDPAHALKQY